LLKSGYALLQVVWWRLCRGPEANKEGGGYCIFKKDKKQMGTYMEGVRERVGQGVEGTTGDGCGKAKAEWIGIEKTRNRERV
jgi:hypothetical protein